MSQIVKIREVSRGTMLVTIPRALVPKLGGAKYVSAGIDSAGRLIFTPVKV
jgi:hypothetical protein